MNNQFKSKNILILVPASTASGGIKNYYRVLKNRFSLSVTYLERGSRHWPYRKGFLNSTIRLLKDYYSFHKIIRKKEYHLVQTTTSFSVFALFRDALYILLTKVHKRKIIVFFRGGDDSLVERMNTFHLWLFRLFYFRTDAIITLSQKNITRYLNWGYTGKIYLETTFVDESLIDSKCLKIIQKRDLHQDKPINLLFLARVEKEKGIYESIDAYNILKQKYNIILTIAGDGKEQSRVVNYVSNKDIKDVFFKGYVDGVAKSNTYLDSDIYIFPSYFEGMPTSVLEAMAFGLPVVTREVGGLPDFFKNNLNGYITESKDPVVIAGLIEAIIVNPKLYKEISINNYNYARENLMSNKVIQRVENIFKEVISS